MRSTRARRATGGFTLLEIVVVLGILVLLANLVLGKLDILQLKANKGAAIANMTGVARYVSTYRSLTSFYPDRWDALCDSAGNPRVPGDQTSGVIGMDPQLIGLPASIEPSGEPKKLSFATIASLAAAAGATDGGEGAVRSIQRVGISTLCYDDLGTDGTMGDHFTVTGTASTASFIATIDPADGDGQAIINHLYPNPAGDSAVPAGKILMVVGLGKYSTLIGAGSGAQAQASLLTDVPTYSNTNQTQYYNRYLVVFEVDAGGSRARMVEVLGGDGDQTTDETGDYYGNA
ncbi:MAG TPA: hypothetical protein VHF22_03985 [Planctomycetota bacterium]|nr:hypothetical protein [Planctomycetota bacterium]